MTTDDKLSDDKLFYNMGRTPVPQWEEKFTHNYATFFYMDDRPPVWGAPQKKQRNKMKPFISEPQGTLPTGVRLPDDAPAADQLMWVLLNQNEFLAR